MRFDIESAVKDSLLSFAILVVLQVVAQAFGVYIERSPADILSFAATLAVAKALAANIRLRDSGPRYGERADGYRPEQDG